MSFPKAASAGFFQNQPLPPPPTTVDYATQAELDAALARWAAWPCPEDYGAIGDGASHTAREVLGVATLAELHAYADGRYAFADSLDNEIDYLAWQAALYRGGIVVGRPTAKYRIDHTLEVPNGRTQVYANHADLLWEAMTALTDDGTNLVVNGDFALGDTGVWVNTSLEPSTDWTFNTGAARWTDGAVGDPNTHFGQMGQQMFLPKGKWTVQATITLSQGASSGYYGPPYCGFAFANDGVGQGFPGYPDTLAKSVTLSPGDDGVPTTLSFDFEITEEAGRTVWLTFSGGNCDIVVDNVRVKPFLMNYAIWCSGDPPNYTMGSTYEYDETVWVGGQFIGPGLEWSDRYTGPAIGGILHKSFRGEGSRCNFRDLHIRKFETGITLGDQAFLQRFEGITIGYCGTCAKYPAGSVNAGENFRFTGCILFNSGLAVDASGGGEWSFFGTSWDYCRKLVKLDRGAYVSAHGHHMETHHAETYIPVSAVSTSFGGNTANVITGGTSGATARLIDDKTDETWGDGPRVVVQLLSGTFQVGETITGSLGGSATVGGAVVRGDYMFEVRGGSMFSMPTGELLMAGSTHNGADYLGIVEANTDSIAFGHVWLYNLQTASDVTWTGGGRVTVERHLGPSNPLFARLWLENHPSDAYAGMGDFSTEGGTTGLTLTDLTPEDGIPLDLYMVAAGTRDSRTAFVSGPSLTIDAGHPRITGGSALRVDTPSTYGSGQNLGVRLLIPVSRGKIVMDRYFIKKPDVMPYITHPTYTVAAAPNNATISATNGINQLVLVHDASDGLSGAGPQAGWTVTFTGLTGTIGGIAAGSINGVPLTIEDVTEAGIILTAPATVTATTSAAVPNGATIVYQQRTFLVWDRRMWVKVVGRTPWDNLPIIVQDQYQGESNYTVPMAAQGWMLANPDGNRWWYTEREVPTDPMDRIGSGRAPEWATHMLVDINLWNYLYAVTGTPPPLYLAGFFANVV